MNNVFDGTLLKIETRVDRTLKLTINTQEVDADQAGKFHNYIQKHCKFLISDDNIIPEVKAAVIDTPIKENGKKPLRPSQIMRLQFIENHASNNLGYIKFDDYYNYRMARLTAELILEKETGNIKF